MIILLQAEKAFEKNLTPIHDKKKKILEKMGIHETFLNIKRKHIENPESISS